MLLSARAPSAAATRRQSVCLAPQRASLRCVAPARSRARDVAVDAVSPNDTVALSLGEVLVSDLMTKPPVCVSPETSVFDVLEVRRQSVLATRATLLLPRELPHTARPRAAYPSAWAAPQHRCT
jgi:CBS domain-containing protein